MEIVPIEKNLPHSVSELICINCKWRGIVVYPTSVYLKNLECSGCGETGYMIVTGENMEAE